MCFVVDRPLPAAVIKLIDHSNGTPTLALKVTWLDAARDLLQQHLTLPCRNSEWTAELTLDPNVDALVPGFPFLAAVRLHVPPNAKPSPVHVSLIHVGTHTAAATAAARTVVQTPAANIFISDVELTLPSMGEFDVVVAYTDDCGTEVNTTL